MKVAVFILGLCCSCWLAAEGVEFLSCPPPPPENAGVCSEDCSDNSECETGQLCCSNGCGHACIDAVSNFLFEVPLVCPVLRDDPETAGICVQGCEGDSDCNADAGERCCSNGCGVACVHGVYPTPRCPAVRDNALNHSLIGAYVPQCEEGGDFSPVQCHASTGYCWCAHAQTGEPISDATQFEQPQCQNCSHGGEEYFVGQDFPAGDGCNSCTCREDGSVICSQIPVPCSMSPPGPVVDDGLSGFYSCPPLSPDVAGICSEDCSSASDCDAGQKCCSNNCGGHTCMALVPIPYIAPPLACPAQETLPGICDLPPCKECEDGFLCCENPCGSTMCAEGVSHPTPCQALQDQTAGGLLGAYRPLCKDDGKFLPLQCHENHCWCVDPDTGKPESDLVLAGNMQALECAAVLCEYEGNRYAPGDTFPAEDGCNTCTCGDGGSFGCTEMGCVTFCEYEGNRYAPGDTFPAEDGCNTCTCGDGGSFGCTEMGCVTFCEYEGNRYEPGDTFPAKDGCNTCTCGDGGLFGCTEIGCDGGDVGDGDSDGDDSDSDSSDGDDSGLGDSDDDTEDMEGLIWWHALMIAAGVTIIALTIGVVVLLLGLAFVIRRNQFHHRRLKQSDSDSSVALVEPDTDVTFKQVPESIELQVPVEDTEPAKA